MYIELKEGVKSYGSGENTVFALDHVNFSLEKGKICVVLGPSGSGKSTLLNVLGGLDSLDGGSLAVDGVQVNTLTKKQLTEYRKNSVGFVFQFYNLIPDLTVKENLRVVSDISKSPIAVNDVLAALEIEKYADRFPRELSGGQQQRAAIARAVVKNPSLLLCDELTGALDTASSLNVLKYIEKVNSIYGATTVIITHNEAIADMADVIVRLRDGKVVSRTENSAKKSAAELVL
ncbi:MAG: ABC transporter ATP-binding protein [Clostridia bacterium]|nr:ABC transporter ATP-binding protein [Clostridia bacterium]